VLGATIVVFVAGVVAMVASWPSTGRTTPFPHHRAVVEAWTTGLCTTEEPGATNCPRMVVTVTDGGDAGGTFTVDRPGGFGGDPYGIRLGDRIIVGQALSDDPDFRYFFVDRDRRSALTGVLVAFGALVAVFGRWHGVRALVGVGVAFAVLGLHTLPAIAGGSPPLLTAAAGMTVALAAAMGITNGLRFRTAVAYLGAVAGVALTVAFAAAAAAVTGVVGLDTADAARLTNFSAVVDLRGVLLAGIVLAAAGVLDDLCVTQVAVVSELAASDPTSSWQARYRAAMRVGLDHVGAAVNTLVLAYAGAALPALLIASGGAGGWSLVTTDVIAAEVVRSAAGTVGIVAALPLTTLLAARLSAGPAGSPGK
jgi:uncharacterized membrane protein